MKAQGMLKVTSPVVYFLHSGPTSTNFHHFPVMSSNCNPSVDDPSMVLESSRVSHSPKAHLRASKLLTYKPLLKDRTSFFCTGQETAGC